MGPGLSGLEAQRVCMKPSALSVHSSEIRCALSPWEERWTATAVVRRAVLGAVGAGDVTPEKMRRSTEMLWGPRGRGSCCTLFPRRMDPPEK